MSKRKSFVLRINPETFKLIEKWAEDEFRSVNGQIEWIVNKGLKDAKRIPGGQRSTKNKPNDAKK